MRQAHSRAGIALVGVATLAALAACGGGSSGGGSTGGNGNGGNASDKTVIWGSIDKPVSFDPAGSYDLPSWNVVYNVYQELVRVDENTLKIVPDAAQSCEASKDFQTWTCKLKPNQGFSNGDALTAKDVKFSFDRMLKINDPNGPASLLTGTGGKFTVSTPDDMTVVFKLGHPNTLWDQVLSTGAGAIVDSKVFPADKKIADDKIIGSGPYALKSYQTLQTAQFVPNDNYGGDIKLQNGGLIINYYQDENGLKLDAQQGKVDVVYPGLSPTADKQLDGNNGLTAASGPGGAIRYMVFNLKTMPGDTPAQKLAIRKAIAYLIDRDSIAKNVYEGTVDPLYTMVPTGLDGHVDVYKTQFGTGADKAKAQQALQAAGVKAPVNLQIWWTPTHYGSLSGDEYTEIKRQLEASGLFKVDLQSTEYQQYSASYPTDKYPIFQLGWFPDYPDTDDYVANFFGSGSFFNNHYNNPKIDTLLQDEQGTTNVAQRKSDFEKIQNAEVGDVPVIPIWQGQQIAITKSGLTGIQNTLKPDYIFRFWVLGKS
jgi:peptide/nickel transport system substrate-binding protein